MEVSGGGGGLFYRRPVKMQDERKKRESNFSVPFGGKKSLKLVRHRNFGKPLYEMRPLVPFRPVLHHHRSHGRLIPCERGCLRPSRSTQDEERRRTHRAVRPSDQRGLTNSMAVDGQLKRGSLRLEGVRASHEELILWPGPPEDGLCPLAQVA